MWRVIGMMAGLGLGAASAVPAGAQDLADFDYENLGFRGVGVDLGWILPSRVEPTVAFGGRMDLGYLGPGLRILPTVSYWSSRMEDSEVRELEVRLNELVDRQSPPGTPPADVDLGQIDWSDLTLGLDAHVVWSVPLGLLTVLGGGASAHIMNGEGEAVADTFIEDLLDTVTAGFNLHTGLEYPVNDSFRMYGTLRYELLGDLRYATIAFGTQFMFGPAAPGEIRP